MVLFLLALLVVNFKLLTLFYQEQSVKICGKNKVCIKKSSS